MLKAKFSDIRMIKDTSKIMGSIAEDRIEFTFDPKYGMTAEFLDVSHACLGCLSIKIYDFSEWECNPKQIDEKGKEKPIDVYKFVVRSKELTKILDRYHTKEEISIEYNPSEKKYLNIYFISPTKGKKPRRFGLPLIVTGADQKRVDFDSLKAVVHPNSIAIGSNLLTDSVKDSEAVDDIIHFKLMKQKGAEKEFDLLLTAESGIGINETYIDATDMTEKNLTAECDNTFAIPFLNSICKSEALSKTVKLAFGSKVIVEMDEKTKEPVETETDLPLKLYYQLSELPKESKEKESSNMLFFVAPRLPEDTYMDDEDDVDDDAALGDGDQPQKSDDADADGEIDLDAEDDDAEEEETDTDEEEEEEEEVPKKKPLKKKVG